MRRSANYDDQAKACFHDRGAFIRAPRDRLVVCESDPTSTGGRDDPLFVGRVMTKMIGVPFHQ
jgi:hypothetical protein